MNIKEWLPLSNLIESFSKALDRGEVNDIIDNSISILRNRTLRQVDAGDAVSEVTEVALDVIQMRQAVRQKLQAPDEIGVLPTASDIESMSDIEEVKALKKKLSQLTGACDKKIS